MAKRVYKRSPAQARQQHLFMRKGQLASMESVLNGIAYDTQLTPAIRDKAHMAFFLISESLAMFDKEVGWK